MWLYVKVDSHTLYGLYSYIHVAVTGRKLNISVGGVIDIQTAIAVAVVLKFTVHVIQSFIKGHRKSGVISIKHSRGVTNACCIVFYQ